MIRDLPSLLAPLPEALFIEHFLEKKRLHAKFDRPERTAGLLPWWTVNRLLDSDTLPPDRLRFVRASVDIAPLMYRRRTGSQRLRAGALQSLLEQGTSILINGVDDMVPQIAGLADAIERRLAHRIGINAYLSFGRASAFKSHWDDHDVLIVQVHGSKRWRSFGSPAPLPVEKHRGRFVEPAQVVWEAVLEAGDVLYLPRGEVHEGALAGEHSVHLTIGITTRRGVDFITWLAQRATADLAFRTDLTRVDGEEALHRREAILRERLHALIDSTSLGAYLDDEDMERGLRPMLNIGFDRQLSERNFLAPAPRRRVPLSVEACGAADVTIGGEHYRLSQIERTVLSVLLERNGLALGDLMRALANIAGDEIRATVIELARKGLLGVEPQDVSHP